MSRIKLDYTEETKMPFGAHAGLPIGTVPASYLLWAFEQEWVALKFPLLHEWIEENMDEIEERKEAEEDERRYARREDEGDLDRDY